MKIFPFTFIAVVFTLLLLNACTIKKRTYRAGYYIDWINFASTKPCNCEKKLVGYTANVYNALGQKQSCERIINASEKNELSFDEGTQLVIPANAFVYENGNPIKCELVNVRVKEFYSKSDIVEAGLTTTSNQRMLVSGGMIYIEATCFGEALKLRTGKKIDVKMPVFDEYANDMKIFSGQLKNGIIDWKAEGKVTADAMPDAGDSSSYVSEGDYEREGGNEAYLLQVTKLGWINCDRFYKNDNPTTLYVLADTMKGTSVVLIFKDIKSVMPGYLYNSHTIAFANIPKGQEVTVLAYNVNQKTNQAYIARNDLLIGKKDSILLNLEEVSLTEFKTMLKEFN